MKKTDKMIRFGKHKRAGAVGGRAFRIAFLLLYGISVCGISVLRGDMPDADAADREKNETVMTVRKTDWIASDGAVSADSAAEETAKTETETEKVPPTVSETEMKGAADENTPTFSGLSSVVLESADGNVTLAAEEYVIGTLLAEMPSSFRAEALKAQAVACRTYAVYKMKASAKHKSGADLCTDSGHCQAFVFPDTVSRERYEAAYAAVTATRGEILCYDGSPIAAVYHASSGAVTCSSAEVWGGERPYLVSVSSGECENPNLADDCVRVSEIPKDRFVASLRAICPSLEMRGDGEILSGISLEKTESGRVSGVCICGAQTDASAFVRAFLLRTRNFTLSVGDSVTITTYGYGHGVGLSQLGAEDMAQRGEDYRAILTHYYPNTVFGRITE